jgi:hypothetical protein
MECTWCGRDVESPGLCERCTLDGFTREEWNAHLDRRRLAYGVVGLALVVAPLVVWIAWGKAAAIACAAGIGLLLVRLGLEGGLLDPLFERKR